MELRTSIPTIDLYNGTSWYKATMVSIHLYHCRVTRCYDDFIY